MRSERFNAARTCALAAVVTAVALRPAHAHPVHSHPVEGQSRASSARVMPTGIAEMVIAHVTVPQPVAGSADELRTLVRLSGDLPPQSVLEQVASWDVTARPEEGAPQSMTLTAASWSASTQRMTLTFRRGSVVDPRTHKWKVLFTGQHLNAVGAPAGGGDGVGLEAATDRDEADLYASGTWLAGRGSAPLFAVDAKYSWAKEYGKWDLGFLGQASVNTDAELPAETSTFDLDAISTAAAVRYWIADRSLVLDMHPIRGEFTKTLGAADLVAMARLTKFMGPFGTTAIRPYLGVEVGAPVIKPDSLYEQAVDLDGWERVTRLVVGASVVHYVFKPEPTPDDLYRLSVSVSALARKPFSDEPYVTTKDVDGKATPVIELRQNVRPQLGATIVWNVNQFVGLQAQYKYGSLPPVFKLADHQVALGLVFKAKRAGARPALF